MGVSEPVGLGCRSLEDCPTFFFWPNFLSRVSHRSMTPNKLRTSILGILSRHPNFSNFGTDLGSNLSSLSCLPLAGMRVISRHGYYGGCRTHLGKLGSLAEGPPASV